MADSKTETTAPKTDAPRAEAPKAAAPAHAPAKAADAPASAPKTEAAPAPKPAAPAPAAAKAAPAPAKAAAKPRRVKAAAKKAAPAPAKKSAPAARKPAVAKAAPAAAKTIKTTSETAIKGTRTMKNETKAVADRFQAVFGDVNERAKTAIERNTRIAEELTELTKGNVEALVASTKVAARGLETLGQEMAEFGRKSFEDASAAFKSFAEIKSPTDFFRLQSEFVRGQFDGAVAESSKVSETVLKLAGEVAQPITSRYSVAAERVKTVVAA
jgi:phasin family protein